MKKNTEKLFSFMLVIIGIAAALMLFLPALSFTESESSFLGYEVVFGTEFVNLGSFASGQIVANIWGILGYLLPLAAGLVALFVKKSALISMVLFAIGAVLLFTLPLYIETTITILGVVTVIDIDWVLSYGLLIATILSALGAVFSLYRYIYTK